MFTGGVGDTSIQAPESIEPYKLITCESSETVQWWVLNSNLEDMEVVVLEEGKKIVWTGPPGRYLVLCSAANGGRARAVVIVNGVPPAPGPTPERTLATRVAELAKGLPEKERAVVAKNYGVVAAQIAAGVLRSIDDINNATKAANQGAVTGEAWGKFFRELGLDLKARFEAGKLTTIQDHQVAWGLISQGLKEAK
jgi:hypothetical protein